MSTAAQAYAKTARTTASPREIEAQALLKAANKLQNVMAILDHPDTEFAEALLFNRKLWAILLSAVTSDENPQPVEVRQNIVNIGTFVMTQTGNCSSILSPKI